MARAFKQRISLAAQFAPCQGQTNGIETLSASSAVQYNVAERRCASTSVRIAQPRKHPMLVEKAPKSRHNQRSSGIRARNLTAAPYAQPRHFPLNLDRIQQVRVNTSAVERRPKRTLLPAA